MLADALSLQRSRRTNPVTKNSLLTCLRRLHPGSAGTPMRRGGTGHAGIDFGLTRLAVLVRELADMPGRLIPQALNPCVNKRSDAAGAVTVWQLR